MALSFQDKVRPVAITSPTVKAGAPLSFQDKIRPVAQQPITPAQQPVVGARGMGDARGLGNLVGGAVYGLSAPGRTIQNLASRGVDKLFGTKNFGQATKEGFEQTTGTDLSSTPAKVGNFAGEVAPYFVGGGEAKGLSFLAKTAANAVKNTAIGTAQTGSLKEGLVTGVGGEVLGALAKPVKAVAKGLGKLAIPTSATEAKLLQTYKAATPFMQRFAAALKGESVGPRTAAETSFEKGLVGTESMIGVQAKRAATNVWKDIVAPALKGVKEEVSLKNFFDDAENAIVKSNPELTRQKSLLNALNAVREDYKDLSSVSLEKLQDLKRGWAQFVPQKAYKGEDIAGALREVQNVLSSKARNTIYTAVKDPAVRKAYLDYGNLTGLQEFGQKAMTGAKLKGGAGSFVSALGNAVLTPITTIGGRVLYRTAQGLEFVGAPGVKTIQELLDSND